MTFLEAVNRVLRQESVIMGDDDDIPSFTATQHAATSALAQIAIQSQLSELVSDGYLPYESKTGVVTAASSTRTYGLATDFQTFEELFFEKQNSSGNVEGTRLLMYPGGESQLRKTFPKYREEVGTPIFWYPGSGTTKNVGFSPVPDAGSAGNLYRYYYEADVNVVVAGDTIPLVSTTEAEVFVRMAARNFKYLHARPEIRETLFPQGLAGDPVINGARSTLLGLLNPLPPNRAYGKRYSRSG